MRHNVHLRRWYLGAQISVAHAVLLSIFGSPVSAMDCEKASGPIEAAICTDRALKEQDARLGRLYFATLKALSGRRHDTLLEDQRIWLEDRLKECGQSSVALPACVNRVTTARIAKISSCYSSVPPVMAGNLSCPVAAYASCPRSRVSASARVWSYPFLIGKLEVEAARARKDEVNLDQCAPEDFSDTIMSVDGAGADWVTVRSKYYAEFRSAPKAFEIYTATTYQVPSGNAFAVTKLMPRLATDKAAADVFWNAAKTAAPLECCDGETPSLSEFADAVQALMSPHGPMPPLPGAWSIQPDGRLKVYYPYYLYGRFYVAVSIVERSVFIAWVDPRYARLFARP